MVALHVYCNAVLSSAQVRGGTAEWICPFLNVAWLQLPQTYVPGV